MTDFSTEEEFIRENLFRKKICANCQNVYIDGDKYCRFCGAPMGSPSYILDTVQTIYGPMPEQRTHVCEKCGYSWKTILMVDKEQYCPKCGGNAPVDEDDQ